LTGKRPSKRQMEMIQLHLTGCLSLEELMAALNEVGKNEGLSSLGEALSTGSDRAELCPDL